MTEFYFYIQVDIDGRPLNHPASKENLIAAFGELPSDWEPFIDVEPPPLGVYEVPLEDDIIYEKINGVWQNQWATRPMTQEEIAEKQNKVKTVWAGRPYLHNWSAWIFDEAKCEYVPPKPKPDIPSDLIMFWCGEYNNWRLAPEYPNDGKGYVFNFDSWVWEEAQ